MQTQSQNFTIDKREHVGILLIGDLGEEAGGLVGFGDAGSLFKALSSQTLFLEFSESLKMISIDLNEQNPTIILFSAWLTSLPVNEH